MAKIETLTPQQEANIVKLKGMSRLYRPSNGTEGEYFMSEHCYQ